MSGRRSSVAGPRGKGGDPRPVSDKAFVNQSIKKLVMYLTEHNFDRTITVANLTSPTTKTFTSILEFLLRSIDAPFTLEGKFEDEVPMIFKALGYPFTISKSSLYAVGSPHTWPSLLASLTWLVDLLVYEEEAAAAKENDQFSQDDSFHIFFDYLGKAYAVWLEGDDETPELDEELAMLFDARNASVRDAVDKLREAHDELQTQVSKLKTADSPLTQAQKLNADLVSDLTKFEKLVANLRSHGDQLQGKLADRQADLGDINKELTSVQADVGVLKDQLSKQELSPADVQRMTNERTRLEKELKCVAPRREPRPLGSAGRAT